MKTRVALRLKTLSCLVETEHGSEPYLWPVMITHETGAPRMQVPTQQWAAKVLAEEMVAGQTIPIPVGMDLNFAEVFDNRDAALVVFVMLLVDKDQLPKEGSVAAIHHLQEKALELVTGSLAQCRERSGERVDLTNALIDRVDLAGAVTDALSYYELSKAYSRPGGFDDALGIIVWTLSGEALVTRDINFRLTQSPERFLLTARLEVSITLPSRCDDERAAAVQALAVVKGLQGQRAALQAQLQHATPQQKPGIVAAITRIAQVDLPPAEAALAQAEAALKACQAIEDDIRGSGDVPVLDPSG